MGFTGMTLNQAGEKDSEFIPFYLFSSPRHEMRETRKDTHGKKTGPCSSVHASRSAGDGGGKSHFTFHNLVHSSLEL